MRANLLSEKRRTSESVLNSCCAQSIAVTKNVASMKPSDTNLWHTHTKETVSFLTRSRSSPPHALNWHKTVQVALPFGSAPCPTFCGQTNATKMTKESPNFVQNGCATLKNWHKTSFAISPTQNDWQKDMENICLQTQKWVAKGQWTITTLQVQPSAWNLDKHLQLTFCLMIHCV